jgi:hypothetical protein
MKFKDYIEEGKKKKIKIKIDSDAMDQKKGIRIPTTGSGQSFKDKSKYSRRKKHKKGYEKDM